eukprot:TRINITY_DN911_c0_g1_i2.p1 TRINITY_DN911_c0_g1~~TRINITY_DN911_c0_g1_i2.p1  ORF type:complete len:487 (+),score=153.23 TRINITY_DN911_c0_g1_i2:157-1617(+)
MKRPKERAYRKGEKEEELWEYYTGDTSKEKKRESSAKKKEKKMEKAAEQSRQKKVMQLADLLQNQDDLLSGRVKCDCQARKHALIGNCLHCGRVVCEQEGKGPCLFCGEWVGMTEEEFASLDPRAKEAMQHRDKLLEFDRTSKKRTHVFDDHSDYFELSRTCWATEKERAIAEKVLQEERMIDRTIEEGHFGADRRLRIQLEGDSSMDAAVVFDPTSQCTSEKLVCEEDEPCCNDEDDEDDDRRSQVARTVEEEDPIVRQKVDRIMEERLVRHVESLKVGPKPPVLINMGFQRMEDRSMYDSEEIVPRAHVPSAAEKYSTNAMLGVTLSMHQPWASLVVHGQKKIEGREWGTTYRGRLWIAATAKKPPDDVIEHVEKSLESIGRNGFPEVYPSGCLLGCVDLVDILPAEEFRKRREEWITSGRPKEEDQWAEESSTAYQWVCQNPVLLEDPIPLLGRPKIYRLPFDVFTKANLALQGTSAGASIKS